MTVIHFPKLLHKTLRLAKKKIILILCEDPKNDFMMIFVSKRNLNILSCQGLASNATFYVKDFLSRQTSLLAKVSVQFSTIVLLTPG